MKSNFLLVGILCWGCISLKLNGQQLPVYSQYTFNNFLLNPAAAGSEGYTAINLTSRRQWVGVEGSPELDAISLQTRIFNRSFIRKNADVKKRFISPLRSGKVGLGFNVYCDRAGALITTATQFTYAYHLVQNKSQFSMGATFGVYQFTINKSKLKLDETNDELLDASRLKVFYPDVNLGVYYTNEYFFVGSSVMNLLQASVNFGTYHSDYKIQRLYSIAGGGNLKLSEPVVLQTSFYYKKSHAGSSQLDITQSIILRKAYWVGFSYRTNKSVAMFLGFKANVLYFGYAFDYGFNFQSLSSLGTHEFMVAIKLGDNTRRYRWVERF